MNQLTDIYSDNPNKQIKKEQHDTKFQLDEIISKQKQFLTQVKYDNFENSNKPSKYWASQLQRKKEKQISLTIRKLSRWNYPKATRNK